MPKAGETPLAAGPSEGIQIYYHVFSDRQRLGMVAHGGGGDRWRLRGNRRQLERNRRRLERNRRRLGVIVGVLFFRLGGGMFVLFLFP